MAGANRTLLSLAAVLALAACSSTTPAPPPAPLNHDAENAAWMARDFTCTRAEAKPVVLDALIAHPERYDEACVRVNAYFTGIYLLHDANQTRALKPGAALAAYAKDKKTETRYRLGPTFAVVSGRLRSCTARTDRQTDVTTPLCRDKNFGLFVSDVQVVPTAMD